MSKRVGLVIIAHSRQIAAGVKELAEAMAPDVHIGATGGDTAGGLGTSFDMAEAVTREAAIESGDAGVVLLADIGSARLTADMVIEMADEPEKLVLGVGPLVEGAVAAAVAAQQGESKELVAKTVADAAKTLAKQAKEELDNGEPSAPDTADHFYSRRATVADKPGLHARPAAQLARLASSHQTPVTINGADAASVVEVMSLGAKYGDEVEVSAAGPESMQAVDAIVAAITTGFRST